MAILIPAQPVRRGVEARGDWQRYRRELRAMKREVSLTRGERSAVDFQLEFSRKLIMSMIRRTQRVGAASRRA
ncbi:hypothetical protein [Burkholderia vietnamiensis]|jgi:hypothetical protein|uniref:Transposase n=1 Tax=Burkholderia vietnamiensis TaxID=60552 RepID=A0ABS1ANH6_BURVI|nr:hypothetical protein [Burkholderia vietnamiensis]KVE99103.1 hypothetical protein WJ03_13740 [Burkholderia vietnamiensis]KVR64858.1 hypothetical protein WK24_19845 [Burkholderia vietnamiensis]KVR89933.1 hypothetical protein WK28_23025 [Burkholderia vietnamiensis]KVR94354.1 hypothetical protein WK27_26740 [Burkholderia vietnamiensis]MBJ9685698.1 hypothetical protein [Burkholderia vietnamiensis]